MAVAWRLDMQARLLELQKKEHSLVGAKHKKERSAKLGCVSETPSSSQLEVLFCLRIGKEMMAIRNSEAYISEP